MLGGAGEYRPQTNAECKVGVALIAHLSGFAYSQASSIFAVVVWVEVLKDGLNPKHTVRQYLSHHSQPTHALTPNKDCEKIAEGKQTKSKRFHRADSSSLPD